MIRTNGDSTWFDDLSVVIAERQQAGEAEYGDRSFAMPHRLILDEVMQELCDAPSWLWVLWHKLAMASARPPADRHQSRTLFLARVRERLANGSLTAPSIVHRSFASDEIERLAAVAAMHWYQARNAFARLADALDKPPADQRVEPLERGQRGGLRE